MVLLNIIGISIYQTDNLVSLAPDLVHENQKHLSSNPTEAFQMNSLVRDEKPLEYVLLLLLMSNLCKREPQYT